MDSINLEKVADQLAVVPETDWKEAYLRVAKNYDMEIEARRILLAAEKVSRQDTDRLKYIANIDDGELLHELEGTNYDTWCANIDAALARYQRLEHPADEGVIFHPELCDDDDDFDVEININVTDSCINHVIMSFVIGVIFYSVASYFTVPWAMGIAAIAFMFSMMELIHKEY